MPASSPDFYGAAPGVNGHATRFVAVTEPILDVGDFGLVGLGAWRQVLYTNRRLLELIRRSADDILGKPAADLLVHTSENDLLPGIWTCDKHGSWHGPLMLKAGPGHAIAATAHLRRGSRAMPYLLFLFA
ncbi:MAG: hypothetical protein ACM3S1_01165 [Hyphomicrobiales bacterium]